MCNTFIFYIGGWYIYRTFRDGVLVGEYMEKADTDQMLKHTVKDVMDDIGRAQTVGLSDGKIPQTGDGEALQFGANG
jgi:hypothetical protein